MSKPKAAEIGVQLRDAFNAYIQDGNVDKLWRNVKAAAMKAPALAQIEAVRQWLEQPVVAAPAEAAPQAPTKVRKARRGKVKAKPIYTMSKSRPVQAAYSLPRHGRSSLLAGLLRGPWG